MNNSSQSKPSFSTEIVKSTGNNIFSKDKIKEKEIKFTPRSTIEITSDNITITNKRC